MMTSSGPATEAQAGNASQRLTRDNLDRLPSTSSIQVYQRQDSTYERRILGSSTVGPQRAEPASRLPPSLLGCGSQFWPSGASSSGHRG